MKLFSARLSEIADWYNTYGLDVDMDLVIGWVYRGKGPGGLSPLDV